MDRQWYQPQDYYHPHQALHPTSPLDGPDMPFGTASLAYPSHLVPASDALSGMSCLALAFCHFLPSQSYLFSRCAPGPKRAAARRCDMPALHPPAFALLIASSPSVLSQSHVTPARNRNMALRNTAGPLDR